MLVILDFGRRQVFRHPLAMICADRVDQVGEALARLERALAQGHHVAGWLAYELGYVLEPALAGLSWSGERPLIRLGIYERPEEEESVPPGRAWCGPPRPEWNAADYGARFMAVKELIASGDIYQANLSFRLRFPFLGDTLGLYEELRTASKALWCGYADDGARQILSLSPELFFTADADGTLTARPMKGTLARDCDPAMLVASTKNRAENLMIVDLLRNDLGRVARAGSVKVPKLFAVETYPSLHTMTSTVTAVRRADCSPVDLLRALFPCGSVTGAPKIRAMEVLRALEESPRGAYCGALGHFAPDGSARFNVAIRTLTIKDDTGELGIGGGVVQDSQADDEYAECLLKARFFTDHRRPLSLIETLRWDDGFVRLEDHLARMAASARSLGITWDQVRARAALAGAVEAGQGPLRVRLTLEESGKYAAGAFSLAPDPPFWRFALSPQRIFSGDPFLRHKTDWRELQDGEAARLGCDEAVFCNERGEVCEGGRSNVFVGRGGVLLTPPVSCGLLPGVLRASLLACGRAREAVLTPDDLQADVWFGNSLRGLIRGRKL
jgi:para-aminobenzoate synthetase/4-amino-4-deoxychorismate lyase